MVPATRSMELEVYFDYSCPYSYRAANWLRHVVETSELKPTVNWRYFSIAQINNQHGSRWKVWDQPDGYQARGIRAFRAAEAARRQGTVMFERFHFALFAAQHEEQRDIADPNVIKQVADDVGMELAQFDKDLASRGLLATLARDHTFAAENIGVFGTPTIVFPEGQAIFLKLATPVPPEDSAAMFSELYHLATQRPYVVEIKRPQRP